MYITPLHFTGAPVRYLKNSGDKILHHMIIMLQLQPAWGLPLLGEAEGGRSWYQRKLFQFLVRQNTACCMDKFFGQHCNIFCQWADNRGKWAGADLPLFVRSRNFCPVLAIFWCSVQILVIWSGTSTQVSFKCNWCQLVWPLQKSAVCGTVQFLS